MDGVRFEVPVGGVTLVGERWDGAGAPVVLLHAGVADRRGWHDVAGRLAGPVIAYDRRLYAWLWLDGPAGPEGRVGGAARDLALAMNERILRHDVPDDAGEGEVDAWSRLEEVSVPTTVIWGDRDVPFGIETCRTVAARIAGARTRMLPGTAHLPSLEQPAELAAAIRDAKPTR